MKKNFLWAMLVVAALVVWSCSGKKPEPEPVPQEPEEQTQELEDLKVSVPVTNNWIFDARPQLTLHVVNPNSVKVEVSASVRINTDLKAEVCTVEAKAEVPAGGEMDIPITTQQDLAPGFYKATCFVNNRNVRMFFFGVSPFQIVSAPDKQEDFDDFWAAAKAQLEAIDMQVELTEIPAKSNAKCKVYLLEMNSVPDGLEGEPVTIRGYYLEPQDGEKHPVLLHYYGYDTEKNPSKVACPGGNSGDWAELYLSHRGQYINNRKADKREPDGKGDFVNIYGDWFAYNFGNKDGYYYRGAFMDVVQSVRFMATRPTSDMENLFAEGSSQGGALCYAAAALSDIPFSAIAPNVAFLGDFPDYFRIVSWPGDTAKKNKGSMTDDQMYAFLSYFDTKNLATRIHCAVWATSGLQDGTCPPHTNMAPFNNLPVTDKQMNFYPEMQHSYPPSWTSDYTKFFKAHMK